MLKKILRPLLFLILALSLFALVWLAGIWANWPIQVSIPVAFAVVVLFFSARRIVLFFRRKIAQAKLRRSAMTDRKSGRLLAIQSLWKSARRNVQGEGGLLSNPLSTLPFYLVLGNSGSGKTTLLLNANIPIRFRTVVREEIPPPTDTIELMLEDKAILLDTSGRYVSLDPAEDASAEWSTILGLLHRTRLREPFNGVVVTLSVEDLWTLDPVKLSQLSQNIRQRIDSLIRTLHVSFPVYVMVTKLDLLGGFRPFLNALPISQTGEMMGVLSNPSESWEETLSRGIREIADRVKSLMFRRADAPQPDPEALVFPLEIEALESLMNPFLKGLFEPSPYLHLPRFRGIFFSSGIFGTPKFSQILGHDFAKGRSGEVEIVDRSGVALPPKNSSKAGSLPSLQGNADAHGSLARGGGKGLSLLSGAFLKDFFTRRLPEDRDLSVPIGLIARWRQMSTNIFLMGWYGASLALGVYLVLSYVNAARTIKVMVARQPGPISVKGDLHQNMESMERYRSLIDWMGQRDSSFSSRLLAFSLETGRLEEAMKHRFDREFETAILPQLNLTLRTRLRGLLDEDPDHRLADYVDILVRRINLIKDRIAGVSFAVLKTRPQPGSQDIVDLDPSISPQEAMHFSEIYLAYISWAPLDPVRQDLDFLQSLLLEVEQTLPDFHWLADWVNARDDVDRVTLATFWKGTVKDSGEQIVLPAYTNNGMKRIEGFLAEVRKASPETFPIARSIKSFLSWYRFRKEMAWFDYIRGFSRGEETLGDLVQWKSVFQTLPGPKSPYLLLAKRLESEFPKTGDDSRRPWKVLLREYLQIARYRGPKSNVVSKIQSYASAFNESGRTGLHGGPGAGERTMKSLIKAGQAYALYSSGLSAAVTEGIQGRGHDLKLAGEYYSYSRAASKKPPVLIATSDALESIRQNLLSRDDPQEKILWNLVSGPFRTALEMIDREAACAIQDKWLATVVAPAQASLSRQDLDHFLLGQGGAIPAFMDKTMAPFVRRSPSGYALVSRDKSSVAVRPSFLLFVNDAINSQRSLDLTQKRNEIAKKKRHLDLVNLRQSLGKQERSDQEKILAMAKTKFPVVIKALPTDVNPEALARPYLTRLTLECAEKKHMLNNLNLPVRRAWEWSSLTCGKTSLEIRLGNLLLTRDYPGGNGFIQFLQQFYQGSLTLTPADFPLKKKALENLRVTSLTVHYRFKGIHALLISYQDYLQAKQSLDKVKEKIARIDQELAIQDTNGLDDQKAALRSQPFAIRRVPTDISLCLPGESPGVSSENGIGNTPESNTSGGSGT
ncbi:MAG: type VI secretion system protein [Nitrospirae bacterium]|nr:type VI secretion system protein [Nitrospirota bacterium]